MSLYVHTHCTHSYWYNVLAIVVCKLLMMLCTTSCSKCKSHNLRACDQLFGEVNSLCRIALHVNVGQLYSISTAPVNTGQLFLLDHVLVNVGKFGLLDHVNSGRDAFLIK